MDKSFKEVGHYRYYENEELGKGNYGKVYKGINIETGTTIAIKQIPKSIFTSQKITELVIREITISKTLKHPNIVKCLDAVQTANNLYIITEYCDGITLEKYLHEHKMLPEEEALKYLKQITSAYTELYDQKIIHRDIKPANLIFHQGIIRICDLGFAKVLDDEDNTNTILGTPLYMSPELLREDPYTNKSDIWALGFVFYQMLYGHTPWTGVSKKNLLNNINGIPLKFDENINISNSSKELLHKMLAIEEEKRISWPELFQDPFLANISSESSNVENPPSSNNVVHTHSKIKLLNQQSLKK